MLVNQFLVYNVSDWLEAAFLEAEFIVAVFNPLVYHFIVAIFGRYNSAHIKKAQSLCIAVVVITNPGVETKLLYSLSHFLTTVVWVKVCLVDFCLCSPIYFCEVDGNGGYLSVIKLVGVFLCVIVFVCKPKTSALWNTEVWIVCIVTSVPGLYIVPVAFTDHTSDSTHDTSVDLSANLVLGRNRFLQVIFLLLRYVYLSHRK